MKINRPISFLLVTLVYIVGLIGAVIVFYFLRDLHIILSTLIADIVATVIVWFFGIILKNSSVYDPYWSVIPFFIALFWMFYEGSGFGVVEVLFLSAFAIWGIRLTVNWALRWEGLDHQDWRYTMLREKNPSIWFLTNLIGINLMPTLIVFICMIPVYYGIVSGSGYNILSIAGFAVCIGAVAIQAISDKQMDDFKKSCPEHENIDRGLWKFSRHPNYFGEVIFWWGIYIIGLSVAAKMWFMVLGPAVMTLLFVFISIPMMEDHVLSSRPGYKSYREEVSMIVPWVRKRQ